MRVLVCGGRDFNDKDLFMKVMDEVVGKRSKHYRDEGLWLPTDIHIIHGGARGADALADHWAVINYCNMSIFEADWEKHGRAAGPIRNQYMLDVGKPQLVVAFPGGRGTADMVSRARAAGVEVIEIGEEDEL